MQLDYSNIQLPELKEKVEFLLDQYDDLSALQETSPLLNYYLYADRGLAPLIPQLLAKKANPNVIGIPRRHRKECPLFLSIFHRNTNATEHLLKAGAEANSIINSSSPLLRAISHSSEIVPLLLQYHANPNLEIPITNTNQTVLFAAMKYALDYQSDRSNMVRLLLAYGSKLTLDNNNDNNIFKLSFEVGQSNYQEYLFGSYKENNHFEYKKAVRVLVRYILLKNMFCTRLPADMVNIIIQYENSPPNDVSVPNNFPI